VKDTDIATDVVTDSIAHIEMYRQIATKEAGLAVSCSEALRKLQELLDAERAALQRQESGAGHQRSDDRD
jgi:predicted HAD superfamily phosphohydrolase